MLDQIVANAPVYLLIAGRCFALVMTLPLFSLRTVPRIAKVAFTGYLAYIMVPHADMSLYALNYRAAERTFSLLTQAAGRAGRDSASGNVVIQTYSPENYSVASAAAQDYNSFYQQEIAYRRLLSYPPCSHILGIQVSCDRQQDAVKQADILAAIVKKYDSQIVIMGPEDAYIGKLKDVYRRVIYLKSKDYDRLVRVKDVIEAFLLQQKQYRNTTTWFDFDPINTL